MVVASRSERIRSHLVNKATGNGVKQQLVDEITGNPIPKADLVRAYDVHDQRVCLTDDELKGILADVSKVMEVLEFVDLGAVDPVFFDSAYYLLSDGDPGAVPYSLLYQAIACEGRAAIAKMVRGQREELVLIRAAGTGLTLHTLFYADEVRDGANGELAVVGAEALKLARLLVQGMSADFQPEKYTDSFRAALQELLQAKYDGKDTIPSPIRAAAPPAGDLMESLQASLAGVASPPSKPAAKAPAKRRRITRKAKAKAS
jgi:DNA end-binding protein Ku